MKKVRVTVSENIWALLQKDSEEFGINNNRLCNLLLNKLKYSREIKFDREVDKESKELTKIVQFDLTVANEKIYYDILRENKVQVEAEFIREIFVSYSKNIKYQRELFVFQDRVNDILMGIKNKVKMKIKYDHEVHTIYPYFIKREDQGDENYLFAYNENKEMYSSFKLKELEVVDVSNHEIPLYNYEFIKKIREEFDPFFQEQILVKVKLTPKGESLIKSLTNYRPEIQKKEKNVYTFRSSLEKAELYFWSLGDDVEILEPSILKNNIKKKAENILKKYD